jgi:hypothetical protein
LLFTDPEPRLIAKVAIDKPVLTAIGVDLGAPPVVCTTQLFAPVTILPGDSIVIQRRWSPTSASGPLPAGRYQLVSSAFGDGQEVASAPASFTVVAREVSR